MITNNAGDYNFTYYRIFFNIDVIITFIKIFYSLNEGTDKIFNVC